MAVNFGACLAPVAKQRKRRLLYNQSIYKYLKHICRVKYTTPSAMLLEGLLLLPLYVF